MYMRHLDLASQSFTTVGLVGLSLLAIRRATSRSERVALAVGGVGLLTSGVVYGTRLFRWLTDTSVTNNVVETLSTDKAFSNASFNVSTPAAVEGPPSSSHVVA